MELMELPLNGNIKDFGLPKILVYLNRNRKNGILTVKTQSFTKKIYIHKGDAVFASSTDDDDRLGETLIKMGKITLEQYDRSVVWGVKYQVKDIIYSLFQLQDAEYEFSERELSSAALITLKMSMGNLIYEGVKRIENLNRIRKELPDKNTVLTLSSDPVSLFQDVVFSSSDKKMLFMVDGKKTLKEIIDSSSSNSFQAMKTLYVLWSTGILEAGQHGSEGVQHTLSLDDMLNSFHEEEEGALLKRINEAYANLSRLDPNELLEIDEQADAEKVKNSYYKLVKEFHPDRYLSVHDLSIKDKVIAILEATTKAYSLLKDDDKRRDYFHKLREIARMNSFLNAIKKRRDDFFESLEESELVSS
jgi:hypothetical protein